MQRISSFWTSMKQSRMTICSLLCNLYVIYILRYQREPLNPYYTYPDLKAFNVGDLRLSIFPFGKQKDPNLNLVIYRPFLMKFLTENIENSDFILYTMATRGTSNGTFCNYANKIFEKNYVESAIFSTITIEWYYNYYFRLHYLMQSPDSIPKALIFRGIIARMDHVTTKSIEIVQQIFDLKDYENVYVIDDLFEGPNYIWRKFIPPYLLEAGIKFHAFNIQPFLYQCKVINHKILPSAMFRRPIKMRINDRELANINISKSVVVNGNDWRLFGNIERINYYEKQQKRFI